MHLIFIDHYDSFSANLQAWLQTGSRPVDLEVIPFDDATRMAALADASRPLVLSPGPNSPKEAAATVQVVRQNLGRVPLLGVCLGHQILGVIAGGSIAEARHPFHGEARPIVFADQAGLFSGMPSSVEMGVYNSLVIDGSNGFPPDWMVTATDGGGEIWGLDYRPRGKAWAFGVQFHPESFLSRGSEMIRENWTSYVEKWSGLSS